MLNGFDIQRFPKFRSISVQRAIVMLTHYQTQAVEIDPDNPRSLRFYLSKGHTLRLNTRSGQLRFELSDPC